MNLRLLIGASVLVAGSAHAQLGSYNPMPGPRGSYAIRNARIVTVTGAVIERGTVVIGADGKIAAVGANVAVPNGATSIDANGGLWFTLRNPWGVDGIGNDANTSDGLVKISLAQIIANCSAGTISV